ERDFLEYVQPFARRDFLGKLVLDAGCGFGRHSFFAARYGAEVLAIDSSADAVQATAHNTRGLERVHVIQGDLHAPPIREGSVDLAMCFGVLHHLQQADEVFEVLGRSVRPGGRFSLWVYGPRQGAALTLTQALRGWTVGLEPIELYRLSQAIALGLRVFSHTPYRFLRGAPGIGSIVNHLPIHDHHRWPRPVVVADVYDRLRIPVTDWFKGEQLEVWYADQGYADVDVTRRVRNNETFLATGLRR
ncbi:MAG: class I SAM-dependent methyltransferase, partial [Myxococcota bacterium]|nr:class I SAM-dependent methyltransferase [Myxococcota bacterium]